MKRPPESPHDEQMPSDWSPERDTDTAWSAMTHLMKEADDPIMPAPSEFEAMLARVRHEVEDDAFLSRREAPLAPSFTEWLRQIFLGGGSGAQAFRFACVGALAFAIGWQVSHRPASELQSPAPAGSVNKPAEVASVSPAKSAGGSLSSPEVVTVSTNDTIPNRTITSINKSGMNDSGKLKNFDEVAATFGWDQVIYPDQTNQMQGFFDTVPTSTFHASPNEASSNKVRIANTVQQLKFHSYLQGDAATLEKIQQLEGALTPLLEDDKNIPRGDVEALEGYRRGEEYLAHQRYTDALLAFDQVRTLAPGSFLAFLAQYQIASIDYDYLRDFEGALDAYRVVLEEYPAHFLTDENKAQILEHVELLTRNKSSDWRALDIWLDAQHTTGPRRISLLRELMETVPESPLAGKAAMVLLENTVGDSAQSMLHPTDLIRLCDSVLASAGTSPHAAQVQFVKAEVIFRRLFDLDRARDEFTRVLQLPGASDFTERTQVRLAQINRRN